MLAWALLLYLIENKTFKDLQIGKYHHARAHARFFKIRVRGIINRPIITVKLITPRLNKFQSYGGPTNAIVTVKLYYDQDYSRATFLPPRSIVLEFELPRKVFLFGLRGLPRGLDTGGS